MSINVCVAGATGWVGADLCRAIHSSEDLKLCGAIARGCAGRRLGDELGIADLTIEVNENGTALVVPSSAVLDDEGRSLVFVRHEGNRFEARYVTLGARESGLMEVTGGLEEGEEVVTNGNFQLKSKLYEAVLEAGHVH